MATDKARVVVYLDRAEAEELSTIAAQLDQSRSALIAEAVSNAMPVLRILGDMGAALKRGPERHREILAELGQALGPVVEVAKAEVESMGGAWPPASNRGVRK